MIGLFKYNLLLKTFDTKSQVFHYLKCKITPDNKIKYLNNISTISYGDTYTQDEMIKDFVNQSQFSEVLESNFYTIYKMIKQ
jgi:hypothetical protein